MFNSPVSYFPQNSFITMCVFVYNNSSLGIRYMVTNDPVGVTYNEDFEDFVD